MGLGALRMASLSLACLVAACATPPMPPTAPPAPQENAMAPEVPEQAAALMPDSVDQIVVLKGERRMLLFSGGKKVREYQVALGRNPVGHKQREGDGRTPEGVYAIDFRKADSKFHRALRISYPSRHDAVRAAAKGVPPGGAIMIHGLPNGKGWIGERHRKRDWTDGCIAVTNEEIEELWRVVRVGTPVEIRG